MTFTRTFTTEPVDGGGLSHWWVADGNRMLAATTIKVGGRRTFFDAVYMHEPTPGGDACRFHDNCEPTALAGHISTPAWLRAQQAGGSDDAVWAELEGLFGQVFGEAVR